MSEHKSPDDTGWWANGITARAEAWAEAVFKRTRGDKPWPGRGGLIDLHAKQAIVDLLHVDETGNRQIARCYELAKAHYEKLRSKP